MVAPVSIALRTGVKVVDVLQLEFDAWAIAVVLYRFPWLTLYTAEAQMLWNDESQSFWLACNGHSG